MSSDDGLPIDDDAWARGRGWPLWKALITVAGRSDGAAAGPTRRVLDDVLDDENHRSRS